MIQSVDFYLFIFIHHITLVMVYVQLESFMSHAIYARTVVRAGAPQDGVVSGGIDC